MTEPIQTVSFEGEFEDLRPRLRRAGFELIDVLHHIRIAVGRGGDPRELEQLPGVLAVEVEREVQVLDPDEGKGDT